MVDEKMESVVILNGETYPFVLTVSYQTVQNNYNFYYFQNALKVAMELAADHNVDVSISCDLNQENY